MCAANPPARRASVPNICLNFDWLSRPTPTPCPSPSHLFLLFYHLSPIHLYSPHAAQIGMLTCHESGFVSCLGIRSMITAMSSLTSSGSVQFLYFIISLLLSIFVELTQSVQCETSPFHRTISNVGLRIIDLCPGSASRTLPVEM
jgi:hypothetical protein